MISVRKYTLLAIIWAACIGFVILNAIGSPDPTHRFYSEVNYYPLLIFVGIPLCYSVVKNQYHQQWLLPAIAIFIGLRLLIIGLHHKPYTDRITYLTELTENAHQQHGGQRFIISEQNVAMDTLIMSWATPFESMLISASSYPEEVKTFLVSPDPNRFTHEMRMDSSLLLMEFNNFPLDALEERGYFIFKKGNYLNLNE